MAVSREVREFRVISARDQKEDGLFELGVEIFYPARNFWGVQFPRRTPSGLTPAYLGSAIIAPTVTHRGPK